VCRLCEFFDTRIAKQCHETIGEEVKEKERANFCDYFQPRPDAYEAVDNSEARGAKGGLETLFGGSENHDNNVPVETEDDARKKLDELFK
jgi:hypothetical protein